MAVKPDILIVPSKLTSFARQILDTTTVVNPGELTKNVTGGTYAVIDVHPRKRDDEIANQQGVQDRVRVDIKRI
jgi:Icc-related predicted phosphoesterase